VNMLGVIVHCGSVCA